MAKTTITAATIAQSLYDAFEAKERDQPNEYGTKTFYSLKRGSPQWMTDAIREAHSGIFPNDWIYHSCKNIAGSMSDTDPSDWDDRVSEWADGEVDVYNADRTRWLASHLDFGSEVDDAVEELGHSDQGIFGDIGIGQYCVLQRIAYALIQAVRAQAEDNDEAADDE